MTHIAENPVESKKSVAVIRKAAAADLPALRQLLSQRDQREWDQPSTNWFLCDLDPSRCIAWVAEADGRLVGLSSAYVRKLHVEGRERRAGYWANLYIDPAYRDQMLYPRLPLAMNQGLKASGLEFLYACVRQREVAATHLRIGFEKVGRYNVLLKPLRPARLIAKHKKLGSAAVSAAAPLDMLYRGWLALKKPRDKSLRVRMHANAIEAVAELHPLLRDSVDDGTAQAWTKEDLRERLRQTREGGSYRAAIGYESDQAIAAVIYRFAQRGNGIQACIIISVLVQPGREQLAAAALAEVEAEAIRANAEVMLYLDGQSGAFNSVLRRNGYRVSSETYDLLIWPKAMLVDEPAMADFAKWRFSFLDHDAF